MSSRIIEVRASAGAKKEGVKKLGENIFKVRVSAAPEKGKANEKIRALLAEFFGVAKSDIELKSGAGSRQKLFSVNLP